METTAQLLGEPLPVELMNTIWADRDGVHDALADPDGTRAWLRAVAPRIALLADHDLAGITAADTADLAGRLVLLRDALRRLAAEATGDPRTAAASAIRERDAAIAAVNQAAGAVPTWSALTWVAGEAPVRHVRTQGHAAGAAVSAIAEEAIGMFSRGDEAGLRACLAPGCVLYFVKDHPRREWCSPSCGNRARSARHYRRHRTGGSD
ncbi:CGNR zinc finger domain-containing protein [Yinghuangia soli]|uniref:CGNR zinc finger domain-containing protein n=1 Tax=Yinghuangia soli TaxID=2908204 RepID=A0AA41Q8S4_9ACTN|nr:CGNR zinc finger domain-containing protein [Yinghuangia soli]MCF2533321.1 CGNR zinc finger domain-containing protein [Yinghuangia soli]